MRMSFITSSSVTLASLGVVTLLLLKWIVFTRQARARSSSDFPALGGSNFVSYGWYCLRVFFHGPRLVHEGYNKYRSPGFKVPTFSGYTHYICDHNLLQEYLGKPVNELSFHAVAATLTQEASTYPTVVDEQKRLLLQQRVSILIRTKLSGDLQYIFPPLLDEIAVAFQEELHFQSSEWLPVKIFSLIRRVLARSENRVFVGKPLCRNPEYLQIVVDFAGTQMLSALVISYFPEALKPFVAKYLTPVIRTYKRYKKLVVPEIEQSLRTNSEGKYSAGEKRLLEGFLDGSSEWPPEEIANKLLRLNFGAIHTSSALLTDTIFELAKRTEYIGVLRDEMAKSSSEGGVHTARTVKRMCILDSFIKETQRTSPLSAGGFERKTLTDINLSGGICIPSKNFVSIAAEPMMQDDSVYDRALEFDGLRYCKEEVDEISRLLTSTSPFLSGFGHGKTACPGRFFAALVIKLILIYLLENYDIKPESEGSRPPPLHINMNFVPDPNGKIFLRKRLDKK